MAKTNEDYTRGVPDFAVRHATERFVHELRQHLVRSALTVLSKSEAERRELITLANATLDEIEDEVHDIVLDRMSAFMRRV